jgi:hypothetical protein
MEMYWVLLLTPGLLSLARLRRRPDGMVALAVVFVLFLVAVGLRDEVGMDWSNYLTIYNSLTEWDSYSDVAREPGFFLINLFAYKTGLGFSFVNLAHAFVFLGGLFYFAARRCPDPFLALAVATPYLVIVVGMSGIRQAAAIGVFMYLLTVWDRVGNPGRIFYLLLASAFHASAILLCSLILFDNKKHPVRLFIVGILVIAAGIYVVGPSRDYYVSSYVENNLESAGAVYHSLLVVAPATLYVLFKRRFIAARLHDPLMYTMALASIAMFPLLAISSTGVDRFILYFTPVQMYVFSALSRVFGRTALRFAIILMCSAILFVWLEYANNSEAWREYGSCITSDLGCFEY